MQPSASYMVPGTARSSHHVCDDVYARVVVSTLNTRHHHYSWLYQEQARSLCRDKSGTIGLGVRSSIWGSRSTSLHRTVVDLTKSQITIATEQSATMVTLYFLRVYCYSPKSVLLHHSIAKTSNPSTLGAIDIRRLLGVVVRILRVYMTRSTASVSII
jgi:hypothetical protein